MDNVDLIKFGIETIKLFNENIKHLTTLNTGMLALFATLSASVLKQKNFLTYSCILTFLVSLVLCALILSNTHNILSAFIEAMMGNFNPDLSERLSIVSSTVLYAWISFFLGVLIFIILSVRNLNLAENLSNLD